MANAGQAWPWMLVGASGLGALVLLALEVARGRREPHELTASKSKPKKKVRLAVPIAPEDRLPPSRPVVSPLRPSADARSDPALLVRCDPAAERAQSVMLVLPGGNYDNCNLNFPLRVAGWLTELGLRVYVLRYRLRSEGHYWPAQEEDCKEAMQQIRRDSAGLPCGVMGFSAGGHLASLAATSFPANLRPDFHVLIYATTDVETPTWDPWKARFGYPGPDFNTCGRVSSKTPPLFAAVSTEDEVTSYAENTKPYVEACRRSGVQVELVLASMGGHGHPMLDAWTKPCESWLRANGWGKPK